MQLRSLHMVSAVLASLALAACTDVPSQPESATATAATSNGGYHPPPPPNHEPTEGCTPGYWKQPHHFDSWVGYSPNQQFSSVFANAFPGMTLLEVLKQGGGQLNALGRHTVAALLNASSPDVDGLTTADVIAAFNAAYASGDYETQKDIFEGFNELGCPLN